jgi:hypothetical protein
MVGAALGFGAQRLVQDLLAEFLVIGSVTACRPRVRQQQEWKPRPSAF